MMILLKTMAVIIIIFCAYMVYDAITMGIDITKCHIEMWKFDKKEFLTRSNVISYIVLMIFVIAMLAISVYGIISWGYVIFCA